MANNYIPVNADDNDLDLAVALRKVLVGGTITPLRAQLLDVLKSNIEELFGYEEHQ